MCSAAVEKEPGMQLYYIHTILILKKVERFGIFPFSFLHSGRAALRCPAL